MSGGVLTEQRPRLTEPTAAPKRRRRRKPGRFLGIFTWVMIAYLMAPIAVIILFGFNNTKGKLNVRWQGFTLTWYRDLLAIPALTTAVRNTLVIALISTLISTVLGSMIGLALGRHRFRGMGVTNLVLFANISSPELVLGSALLGLFITTTVPRGFTTILLAHVMFSVPFVAAVVRARLAGFDFTMEEAAQDLGADPLTTFRKITFPLIFPGILAGALLAFALSIDDYIITSFVNGQTITFPIWVFGATRIGVPPQVNVMGTLIFLGGVLLAVLNAVLARRREL